MPSAVGHALQLLSETVIVAMLLVLLPVVVLKLVGVHSDSPRAARLNGGKAGEQGQQGREGE